MSGHSKWSSIKHKKGITDQRRSKMFAKLLRAVEVGAREGGGNIEGNMTLASAVQKARDSSVPMDNIERAIKRGSGELEGARYENVMYEGYAPGGVLAEPGSVAWQFDRKGVIMVDRVTFPDEDRLLELALEAGAEDLTEEG